MIFTIEKRSEFSGGTMVSHYEVRSYERRTSIGVLVGVKTFKKAKTKSEAMDYFGMKGVIVDD